MNLLEMLMGEAQQAPESDVRDALMVLVNRRVQREQEAERTRKHADILPLCRAALDKVTRIRDVELPAAAERAQESWQTLDAALRKLWKHQANKLAADRYPSSDETAVYDELTAVLESEAAEARAEKIAAETAQAALIRDYLATAEELAKLQREERGLRREVEEPHRTGLSLSGVR